MFSQKYSKNQPDNRKRKLKERIKFKMSRKSIAVIKTLVDPTWFQQTMKNNDNLPFYNS